MRACVCVCERVCVCVCVSACVCERVRVRVGVRVSLPFSHTLPLPPSLSHSQPVWQARVLVLSALVACASAAVCRDPAIESTYAATGSDNMYKHTSFLSQFTITCDGEKVLVSHIRRSTINSKEAFPLLSQHSTLSHPYSLMVLLVAYFCCLV